VIIISFQRLSKIVAPTNLKMVARWKECNTVADNVRHGLRLTGSIKAHSTIIEMSELRLDHVEEFYDNSALKSKLSLLCTIENKELKI
jgi:hypothetical protein